jgi:hypothetical protein
MLSFGMIKQTIKRQAVVSGLASIIFDVHKLYKHTAYGIWPKYHVPH